MLQINSSEFHWQPWWQLGAGIRIARRISHPATLWNLSNAPYLVTDLFHFEQRPPVPYWYDLMIVISGAWNGAALGITSLLQVEKFLAKHIKVKWRMPSTIALIILCSYGIYLGRYKRYNSWNIVTKPEDIAHTMLSHITEPWEHMQAWMFTVSFAILLNIIYFTVKKMPAYLKQNSD